MCYSESDIDASPLTLRVQRLRPAARLPTRAEPGAAGCDLYAPEDAVIPARGQTLIELGIAVELPAGTYGRLAPRSGLAARHSLHVGAGVVDASYRGELAALLFNHGDRDYEVRACAFIFPQRVKLAYYYRSSRVSAWRN